MSILSALGLSSGRKVRYGIVALGDISQEAMLPGIDRTGNSEVTALVTGDPEKARRIGERYGVTDTYDYAGFDEMIRSGKVDAIYLATPNWRHTEFAVPALRAGIHVLVEKPMEVTAAKCAEMIAAAKESGAKLMVAYRLHFEPATLDLIDTIRSGQLGEVTLFTSAFAQMVSPANHRATNGVLAGPLFDMGPYPLNAARYVFEAEPTEVISATAIRHAGSGMDLDDTVAVTLRFPGNRIAQFTVSYYANAINTFSVVGTKGSVQMNPGFTYGEPLKQAVTLGETGSERSFKTTDQFAGEMRYFSSCILEDKAPEPDGEEGLADVRVIEAILRAIETGRSQPLEPFPRTRRIDTKAQLQTISFKAPPEPVNAASPTEG